jgi:flagellin-like protein
MKFTKNDEAVSPVIGVILMVAITVILAAVIAAFVFGMAGNINKTKVVSITVQRTDSANVVVTNMGGQDVTTLTGATITVDGGSAEALGVTVGSSAEVGTETDGAAHIVVTGEFSDGTQQVLLDTNV